MRKSKLFTKAVRGAAFFLVFLAFASLSGCSSPPDYLAYQRGVMSFEAEFSIDGEKYAADISLGEAPGDIDSRIMQIRYTSPVGIEGLCVRSERGEVTLGFGGLSVPARGGATGGLLDVCRLLCIDEPQLCDVRREEISGVLLNIIEVADSDGVYTVWLDTQSSAPLRIEGRICGRDIILELPGELTAPASPGE